MRLVDVDVLLKQTEDFAKTEPGTTTSRLEPIIKSFSAAQKIPKYAILSHRWFGEEKKANKEADEEYWSDEHDIEEDEEEDKKAKNAKKAQEIDYQRIDETSFRDLFEDAMFKDSALKLVGLCSIAKERGYKYAWSDTCCINKRNQAELNESLTSMFKWYQKAACCFAYLHDVTYLPDNLSYTAQQFRQSQWFTRGWTLQEMLAPTAMEFFDKSWQKLGTRKQLEKEITTVTGIATNFLQDFISNRDQASIATRMSWVSQRRTTRGEDLAYCLFGIFNVTMDLQYGVGGRKEFYRLQEKILTQTKDESIFAWTSRRTEPAGLLASSPRCFRNFSDILLREAKYRPARPYQMINGCIRIPVPPSISTATTFPNSLGSTIRALVKKGGIVRELPIAAWKQTPNGWRNLNVYLQLTGGKWQRVRCNEVLETKSMKGNQSWNVQMMQTGLLSVEIEQLK